MHIVSYLDNVLLHSIYNDGYHRQQAIVSSCDRYGLFLVDGPIR